MSNDEQVSHAEARTVLSQAAFYLEDPVNKHVKQTLGRYIAQQESTEQARDVRGEEPAALSRLRSLLHMSERNSERTVTPDDAREILAYLDSRPALKADSVAAWINEDPARAKWVAELSAVRSVVRAADSRPGVTLDESRRIEKNLVADNDAVRAELKEAKAALDDERVENLRDASVAADGSRLQLAMARLERDETRKELAAARSLIECRGGDCPRVQTIARLEKELEAARAQAAALTKYVERRGGPTFVERVGLFDADLGRFLESLQPAAKADRQGDGRPDLDIVRHLKGCAGSPCDCPRHDPLEGDGAKLLAEFKARSRRVEEAADAVREQKASELRAKDQGQPSERLTQDERECPHGEFCCQSEPCKGPRITCEHCGGDGSNEHGIDCAVCGGEGDVLALAYINRLAERDLTREESPRPAVVAGIVSTMAVADALGWDKEAWTDAAVLAGVRAARAEADMFRRKSEEGAKAPSRVARLLTDAEGWLARDDVKLAVRSILQALRADREGRT